MINNIKYIMTTISKLIKTKQRKQEQKCPYCLLSSVQVRNRPGATTYGYEPINWLNSCTLCYNEYRLLLL